MASDTITRKEIITDDAVKWGSDYVKEVEKAIGKNQDFINSMKILNDLAKDARLTKNINDFTEAQKKADAQLTETDRILREQIKLEEQLANTKAKQKVANSDTAKQLAEEKLLLQQTNAEVKKATLERLGLTGAYKKLSDARLQAKNRLRDLIASEKASNDEIRKAQKEFDILDQKVRKADKAVGDFSKNVGNYKTAFGGLKDIFSAFGIVGGITGFVALAKDIFNTTKELQSLDLALKSVTETQANFRDQQIFLNAIAQKYGLEINNLTKQYTAFYVAAKDKLAASQIQELFENIAKSGSTLGLSNETLERSFTAINQMLSKGTVASEELRGQLAESLPGAVQAMTQAVQKLHPELKNLTEKDLFEMIKAGKILAAEVLPETARQLVELTGADKSEGIDTLTKSTNRLKNEWIEFIRITSESDLGGFFAQSFRGATIIMSGFLDVLKQIIASTQQLSDAEQMAGQGKGLLQFNEDFKNQSGKTPEQQKKFLEDLIKTQSVSVKEYAQLVEKTNKEIEDSNFSYFQRGLKRRAQGLAQQLGFERGILIAAQQKLEELNNPLKPPTADAGDGVRIQAPRKTKLDDSEFQLQKQRLELAIQTQDQIAKNQELTDLEREKATAERGRKEIELIDLVKAREFAKNKEVYDNSIAFAKKKLESDLSNPKITADGQAKAQNDFNNAVLDAKDELLNANEKTKINEKYAFDKLQIEKRTAEEIKKLREFDTKEYEDELKRGLDQVTISNENAIQAEQERFNALKALGFANDKEKEKAAEDHERILFNIKKAGLIAQTKLQINALTDELNAYEAQSDGSQKSQDFILNKRAEVAKLSRQLTEAEGSTFNENEKKKAKTAKEQIDEILNISSEALGNLADLSNAFSEGRIQKLEEEIDKNNEYYDKQLELAGNDENQKKQIEKEREIRNAETNKKIVKEKEKQAKFDKAVNIAQIAIATALSIVKASPNPVLIALAAVTGAIALATAIATPIPKFKKGTQNAPAGLAVVGDGGVPEIITNSKGLNPVLTPSNDTLVNLNKGDKVFPNMGAYQDYLRNQQIRQMGGFGEVKSDDRLLDEMKQTRKSIERLKLSVNVKNQKIDINHAIWRNSQTRW